MSQNKNQLHQDIPMLLISQLQKIDLVGLIRPDSLPLTEELSKIKEAQKSGDIPQYEKLDAPKSQSYNSRTEELESTLTKIKKTIKPRNYVVVIVSEILRLAKINNWNLCKHYDYVFIYNGSFWKQFSRDDLKTLLGEAAIKFGYSKIDAKYHQFKDDLLKQFLTEAHLTVLTQSDKTVINLQNGTFVFTGGSWSLKPHDPKDFLTYQLAFDYNPSASCPVFEKYLNRVLPDVESQKILQEFCGYIFTEYNLEKCMVLTGSGSNGKSVFFNVLTALLGPQNTLTFNLGMFNQEYNRAKLVGVLLNYSSEKGLDLNPETFKALISGEPQQAREPYGKPFTLMNKVKFIMNCNELPKETENTDAYFRRFLIIPFNQSISEQERDIHLADTIIKSELPGIFNWILEGLNRLHTQQRFSTSKAGAAAVQEFRKNSDNVALFIDDHQYIPCPNEKHSLANMYREYSQFCREDGYRTLGKNKFAKRLELLGFERARGGDGSIMFLVKKTPFIEFSSSEIQGSE